MFELPPNTELTLKSVTPRTEKHGDEDVFAVSLGLKLTGPNTLLDLVQPGLLDMLYTAPPDDQAEIPDVERVKPLLRTAGVESVKLTACLEGWTLHIDRGVDADQMIVLGGCKVDSFVVHALQGGSVELHFRVGSSDIDADEAGWICASLKQPIFVGLTAPKKLDSVIDGTVGHEGLAKLQAEGQGSLLDDAAAEEDAGDAFARLQEDDDGESRELEDRLDDALAAGDAEDVASKPKRRGRAAVGVH